MSNALDKPRTIDPQDAALLAELDEVFFHFRDTMKPKAIAKTRKRLEALADRLEIWEGCRLPMNVTPLRPRMSEREQAVASEAQRKERAARAAAIRALIGRAF